MAIEERDLRNRRALQRRFNQIAASGAKRKREQEEEEMRNLKERLKSRVLSFARLRKGPPRKAAQNWSVGAAASVSWILRAQEGEAVGRRWTSELHSLVRSLRPSLPRPQVGSEKGGD
eukprot:scaffold503_cov375-Pinguiococcus_pyrenoidosus.AAC.7